MIGRTTLKNIVKKSAPRSAEASSISTLIWCSLLIPASTPTARNRNTQFKIMIKIPPGQQKWRAVESHDIPHPDNRARQCETRQGDHLHDMLAAKFSPHNHIGQQSPDDGTDQTGTQRDLDAVPNRSIRLGIQDVIDDEGIIHTDNLDK